MRYFLIPFFMVATFVSGVSTQTHNVHAESVQTRDESIVTSVTDVHPVVIDFIVLPDGSAMGTLANGEVFRQYNVPNDFGIRIQRFELPHYSHYIVEGDIVYTQRELSIRLARI